LNVPAAQTPTPPPNHPTNQRKNKTGLGYRAKFIRETAQKLQGLGKEAWLLGLRAKGRGEVQVRGVWGLGRVLVGFGRATRPHTIYLSIYNIEHPTRQNQ
jgi:hypothetical protein